MDVRGGRGSLNTDNNRQMGKGSKHSIFAGRPFLNGPLKQFLNTIAISISCLIVYRIPLKLNLTKFLISGDCPGRIGAVHT